MNATDLSFLIGLGRTPDDHALDFLRGTPEEANAALEFLDANLRNSLLVVAASVLRDLDAAEDAVQCALVELLRNRAASATAFVNLQARGDASAFAFLRAQLVRTVYRRALDRLRRGRRQAASPLDEALGVEVPVEVSDPLLHKLLHAALGGLDPEARLAVASRFAGCETHDEAAEFMGASRSVAAAAAWRRAVYRLRQCHALRSYVASLDGAGAAWARRAGSSVRGPLPRSRAGGG